MPPFYFIWKKNDIIEYVVNRCKMSNRNTPTKTASTMEAAKIPLTIVESDIVKLILEFLETRGLHIAQVGPGKKPNFLFHVFDTIVLYNVS